MLCFRMVIHKKEHRERSGTTFSLVRGCQVDEHCRYFNKKRRRREKNGVHKHICGRKQHQNPLDQPFHLRFRTSDHEIFIEKYK